MSASDEAELRRIHELDQQAAAEEAQPPEPPSQAELVMRTMFGGYFNPQPFSWALVPGSLNGKACHYLAFEHAHGRFCVPLADQEMMQLGQTLIEKASGIVIPNQNGGLIIPGGG